MMRVRKAIWMPGLFVVFALVLAACGGSDPTATPVPAPTVAPTADASSQESSGLTAEESEYLAEVVRAERTTFAVFSAFGSVISQVYPLRETLLAALLEGGVGTPYIEKTAILESLDPPDTFREDHDVWLTASKELLRLDGEAAQAVEAGDLVSFAVLNGIIAGVDTAARIGVSPAFCQNVALTPEARAVCVPEDSALSGDYQVFINALIRQFIPEFATLRGNLGFRLSLDPEELVQIMEQTAENSIGAMQGFATELDKYTPPEELCADHERLRAIFALSLEIVTEVDRLSKANDLEGARNELQRSDPAVCDARASFEEPDFKDAVRLLFEGGPRTCGGTSF